MIINNKERITMKTKTKSHALKCKCKVPLNHKRYYKRDVWHMQCILGGMMRIINHLNDSYDTIVATSEDLSLLQGHSAKLFYMLKNSNF